MLVDPSTERPVSKVVSQTVDLVGKTVDNVVAGC